MNSYRRPPDPRTFRRQELPDPPKTRAAHFVRSRRSRFFLGLVVGSVILALIGILTHLLFPLEPKTTGIAVGITAQADTLSAQIDSLFKSETEQQHFSGSVLIARDGQPLLEAGYGQANWDSHAANDSDTRFYLGSVTKEFTATGILLLQEQGKLHVTDHLCTFVEQCPSSWQAVTLHELLIHTSGIPDLDAFELPRSSWSAWFASFASLDLEFPAGSKFHYCNTCYKLLAYVVQVASGLPYAQFLQQNIFTPLQMSRTGFTSYYTQTNDALGYETWEAPAEHLGTELPSAWSWLQGSGLLYSTVNDLYRWDESLYAHTVLSQHSQDLAFTAYVAADLFPDSKYGYGWFISHSPIADHPLIWHDGVIDGFRAYIGRYIKDHITIIFLSNLATLDPLALAQRIQALLFAETSPGTD